MREIIFWVCVFISVWVLYVFSNIPKYKDGVYVSFFQRVRQIPKRVVCKRNKQRADDP